MYMHQGVIPTKQPKIKNKARFHDLKTTRAVVTFRAFDTEEVVLVESRIARWTLSKVKAKSQSEEFKTGNGNSITQTCAQTAASCSKEAESSTFLKVAGSIIVIKTTGETE